MNPLNKKTLFVALSVFLVLTSVQAQDAATPRHITLQEAVQLALKHNHFVRIANFQVEEKQHAKDKIESSIRRLEQKLSIPKEKRVFPN